MRQHEPVGAVHRDFAGKLVRSRSVGGCVNSQLQPRTVCISKNTAFAPHAHVETFAQILTYMRACLRIRGKHHI